MIEVGTYWKFQTSFNNRARTRHWIYVKITKLEDFPKNRCWGEFVSLGHDYTHIDMNRVSYTHLICKEQITREEYLKAVNEGVHKALNAIRK